MSTCQPNVSKPSTTKLAKHIPSGFTYKIVGPDDSLTEDHVTYRGDNDAETFVEHMMQVEIILINILRNSLPLSMSTIDEKFFQAAEKCYICKNWVQIVFATIAMSREGSKVPHILLATLI